MIIWNRRTRWRVAIFTGIFNQLLTLFFLTWGILATNNLKERLEARLQALGIHIYPDVDWEEAGCVSHNCKCETQQLLTRGTPFTDEDDQHLVKYLATYSPGTVGRCGTKLYKDLVENVGGADM